jgi:phage protein U
MASMAQWNGIVFKVNSKKIFTFKNMKRSYSTRWATHDIIGRRPRLEYQGPAMDEVTIDVVLDAEHGVKPRKTMLKFQIAAHHGDVAYFYIAGKKMTKYKMYIASGSENWDQIWNKGELVRATATLTFREYR